MTGVPAAPRGVLDRCCLWLAAGFGAGFSRVAPGTAGTAAAAGLAGLLALTPLPAMATVLALAALTTAASLAIGARLERLTGQKDPQLFVLDEFAGYYVALTPFSAEWPPLREWVVAFLLFRLFDIIKPPPARRLQDLGGGLGIVLDDLVAGLYALAGVAVYRDVLQNPPW